MYMYDSKQVIYTCLFSKFPLSFVVSPANLGLVTIPPMQNFSTTSHKARLPSTVHSRPQRLCSFWSAAGIAASGQVQPIPFPGVRLARAQRGKQRAKKKLKKALALTALCSFFRALFFALSPN